MKNKDKTTIIWFIVTIIITIIVVLNMIYNKDWRISLVVLILTAINLGWTLSRIGRR